VTAYCVSIVRHYASKWSDEFVKKRLDKGPVSDSLAAFRVLEFHRSRTTRLFWTDGTCCMSQPQDSDRLELHLFWPIQHEGHVELLIAVAHHHRTGEMLAAGHTVSFGRPWLSGSTCDYGLISLPHLDGPSLEKCREDEEELGIRFLWLVPITKAERECKKANGVESLERKFEYAGIDFLNQLRESVA
jgi:Suppressor of fused protein (SUFU)